MAYFPFLTSVNRNRNTNTIKNTGSYKNIVSIASRDLPLLLHPFLVALPVFRKVNKRLKQNNNMLIYGLSLWRPNWEASSFRVIPSYTITASQHMILFRLCVHRGTETCKSVKLKKDKSWKQHFVSIYKWDTKQSLSKRYLNHKLSTTNSVQHSIVLGMLINVLWNGMLFQKTVVVVLGITGLKSRIRFGVLNGTVYLVSGSLDGDWLS